jgi:Trypsin-like peptidase domain
MKDSSDAIVLITSRDRNRRDFGTGFVIDREGDNTYVLTCAHVVRDVGGKEQVVAGGIPAIAIASGEEIGFDLALLQVQGLENQPCLGLRLHAETNQKFKVAGFYQFDPKSPPALRMIRGTLGEAIQLASRDGSDRINGWDLKIEGDYYLQPGYSGSPVIDITNGCVLGIVTHQIGKGEKGLAISIEALAKIWLERYSDLIIKSLPLPPNPNPTSALNILSSATVTNFVGAGQVLYNEAPNQIRDVNLNLNPPGDAVSDAFPISNATKQRQCQMLRQQLDDTLELLADYQQQQRLTSNPKERQIARIESERLEKLIEKYEQDLKKLGC